MKLYFASGNEHKKAELSRLLGGYELEARARQILAGLGFPVEDFDKPACDFSGGWQMRISLSKLLLRHPDLLLLDEPTNHLDLESVRWLEQFLASYDGAVLLVSHDRAFMDACVSHVAAVENRRITTYTANYSSYLRQREDNLEQMRAKRAAQEREIAHMQVFVDKFRYKPTKAAQAQERMKKIEQIKSELVINRLGTALPETERSRKLMAVVDKAAAQIGQPKPQWLAVGGASDGIISVLPLGAPEFLEMRVRQRADKL